MYNCVSWFALSEAQVKRLQAPIVRALRFAHGKWGKDGKPVGTEQELLQEACWPVMHAELAIRRLKLFRRMLLKAPSASFAIMHAANGWRKQVVSDLRWLQALSELEVRARPDPDIDSAFWVTAVTG